MLLETLPSNKINATISRLPRLVSQKIIGVASRKTALACSQFAPRDNNYISKYYRDVMADLSTKIC